MTDFCSVLTNGPGGCRDDAQVEVFHAPLHDGNQLLLCTDGPADLTPEEDIVSILSTTQIAQTNC